jgi:hypothetical protein
VLSLCRDLLHQEPALSRNRHFDAWNDPLFKRSLRLSRRLRQLADDVQQTLNAGGTVAVNTTDRGPGEELRVQLHGPRVRRQAYLSGAAFRLLVERWPALPLQVTP